MTIRLFGVLLTALSAPAFAVTHTFTPSVQGEIITRGNIGQSFISPNNADRYLEAFTLRGQPVDWSTWMSTVDATIRLAVFRFDGTSVVGDPLYTSAPLLMTAGDKRPVTFRPHVALERNTEYLAVIDKLSFSPSQSIGFAWDANTMYGSGDAYGPGRIQSAGLATYPFTNATWYASDTNDLYFHALFNVPEPTGSLGVGISTGLLARRKRQTKPGN